MMGRFIITLFINQLQRQNVSKSISLTAKPQSFYRYDRFPK